jgi:metal-responsive CopG/Arc/MetJ family transcriptional regulator
MKTAVSVPDELYAKAEKYAKTHKISRSELYQEALERYLTENADSEVTRRLNEVYAAEDSSLPVGIAKMQARTIRKHNEPW